MKHAILIIGHKNFRLVMNEVARYDDDFAVFIHWDKRHALSEEQKKRLYATGHVAYIGEEFPVNWASYGIVRATLLLCGKALGHGWFDYFHLVSDADTLTVGIREFKAFFERNRGKNFLHHAPLSETSEGIYKLKYRHRMEVYDIRGDKEDDRRYREELQSQQDAGRERELPPCRLYWGSAWWSLQHDCVQYLLGRSAFIEKYFVDTLFPDEHFAQVIIMNSRFAQTVENDNLRYVSWTFRNGNRPAVLDRSDLPFITEGNYLYARKIDEDISRGLLDVLHAMHCHTLSPEETERMTLGGIIRKVLEKCDDLQGGLAYGRGGALVFLSQCYRLQIEPGLVTAACVEDMREKVLGELMSASDESWKTGRPGLMVALAYCRNAIRLELEPGVEGWLSEMEASAVNHILNSEETISEKDRSHYLALLRTTADGRGSDAMAGMALSILGTPSDREMSLDMAGLAGGHVGLRGLSGLGLMKLTQEKRLPSGEWNYLLI